MPSTLHERSSSLPVTAPFALDHSLSFLCSFPPTSGEQALAPRALTKALSIGGRAVLARIEEREGALSCTTWSEGPRPERAHAASVARLRFQLSLDDDLAPLAERARTDRAFASIARRFHGHHHVKFPSPFEIAVWAVLAQRNMRLGKLMKDALVRALGPTLTHEGVTHRAFPEPEALTDVDAVRAIVPAHADAIVAIARAFSDAALVPALLAAPLDEAEARLRSLPRIGPWSAAFILFRGLGRMERLAERSDPILRAARRAYGPRTEGELRDIAASYGSFCGYWALYLRRAAGA
ncbi:MAG: hypothetical protein U0234_14700 [Sandaracinus sp.]